MEWLDDLVQRAGNGEIVDLPAEPLSGPGRLVALAPHPDDTEAIAVTLQCLQKGGWQMTWVYVTGGWAGVLDDYVGTSKETKALVREMEQEEAADAVGQPRENLVFLRLHEGSTGKIAETRGNREALAAKLTELAPDLVTLPFGQDSNETHRLVWEYFTQWADRWPKPLYVLANEDPKSIDFTPHLRVHFDQKQANWKIKALECHRSQTARNREQRGMTFSTRIMDVNRADPEVPAGTYVERFQVYRWPRPKQS